MGWRQREHSPQEQGAMYKGPQYPWWQVELHFCDHAIVQSMGSACSEKCLRRILQRSKAGQLIMRSIVEIF